MLPPKMGEGVSALRVGAVHDALEAVAAAASALTTTRANRLTGGTRTLRCAATWLVARLATCMAATGDGGPPETGNELGDLEPAWRFHALMRRRVIFVRAFEVSPVRCLCPAYRDLRLRQASR